MDALASTIPENVPAHLVVDFDYNHPVGVEHGIQEAWHQMHEGPDIFWTPRHGGHWVVTRMDDIMHVLKTYEDFSNHGLTIPKIPIPYRMLPLGEDPPESTPFRDLIQPFFLPKAVQNLEKDAREISVSLIEGFLGRGECEFMTDFAQHLPLVIFLRLVDLPLDDRPALLDIAERFTRGTTVEIRAQAQTDLMAYLDAWIEKRRGQPGNDLISRIVTAEINGKPISDSDARGLLSIVVFGGLDTVASTLGFFADFLARNTGHRQQLVDNPALIPAAVEELMRRYGGSGVGREVTRDFDYKGLSFKRGDLVWVQTTLAGLDERHYPDPLKVDFQRKTVIHAGFGNGVHRCPGSFLARTELKVFMEEWLKRIPQFRVKPDAKPVFQAGSVSSFQYLPLVWDT